MKLFFYKSLHRSKIPARVWLLLIIFLASCNDEEPGLVHQSQVRQWQYLTEKHGLASDNVNTVFEDSKGDIWIGTSRGLSVLRDSEFITYTGAHGLLDNNVFAISEDRDGQIWVGTRRGVNILVEDQWLYFNYFYNAPVFSILHLKNEAGMLISTAGYGIYRYDYETSGFEQFEYIDGCQSCNSINSMFQAKDESIWIASSGGVRRIRGNFITRFDEDDGMSGEIATTITEDSWGNIWIGTVEGKTISKITGNSVSQISFNNGADQNFIFGIQEDNDGTLWVGTVGNGLFHYDGAIMSQVYGGPTDDSITAIFKDSHGNLWIGTSETGVAVYINNPIFLLR